VNDILKRHPLSGEVFIQPGKFYLQYLGRTVGEYAEFSSRSTTVGGIESSACLLQEEVNHLKVCLKVAGTHEGESRGVLFQ
jgi:hypothetical protein